MAAQSVWGNSGGTSKKKLEMVDLPRFRGAWMGGKGFTSPPLNQPTQKITLWVKKFGSYNSVRMWVNDGIIAEVWTDTKLCSQRPETLAFIR